MRLRTISIFGVDDNQKELDGKNTEDSMVTIPIPSARYVVHFNVFESSSATPLPEVPAWYPADCPQDARRRV